MATKKNSSNATETPGIEDNEEKLLKDPEWVEKALKKATVIELSKYEEELANLLIEL